MRYTLLTFYLLTIQIYCDIMNLEKYEVTK